MAKNLQRMDLHIEHYSREMYYGKSEGRVIKSYASLLQSFIHLQQL